MPPGTQSSYTQLPDGRWIPTPTTPEDLARLKTWVDSYRTAHSEKGGVAALPDANAQAKASINTDLQPVSRLTGQQLPNPKQTNDTDKSAGSGTDSAVRSFNEGATGSASVPEFFKGVNELRKEGPISAITDVLQHTSDATTDAMQKYGENDPKRYLAAVPFVGPSFAANEEKPFVEGLAGDIGTVVGGMITGKAFEAVPEAAANTVRATNQAYEKIFSDPKMSMRDATTMLADELSTRAMSPGEYGKSLQDTFETVKNKAGQEKGEFVASVMRDNPDFRVSPRAVNAALQEEVKNLQFMKERNPELFNKGEGLDKTLSILERELRNTQDYNLAMADTRRSQFWNYKQQLDPSMASRVVGRLDKATTEDITNALAQKNPELAKSYLEKSARYKELNDIGRADVLRNVFGNKQVSPDRVMEFLNKAPEESIKAIQTMQRENPQAVADLRRQMFEQSIKTAGAKGFMKMQPELLKAVYGPQAEAVQQFMDVINKKAGTADTLLTKVPGKAGVALRIAAAGDKPTITIKASEMAKILRSSEIMRLFSHAAETPAAAGPSGLMRDTLQRAMDSLGIRSEAEQKPSRVPAWKREGGGGENPPGGTPAPNTPPSPLTPPGGGNSASDIFGSSAETEKSAVEKALNDRETRRAERQRGLNRAFGEAYEGTERRASTAPDRRTTGGGQSPTGAERRTGAADRQLTTLQDRLKTATGRDKEILEAQIKSIKENPGDPEYVDRRGQRAAGQGSPKADVKKMNDAVEKQRQRLKEFEEERDRILKE